MTTAFILVLMSGFVHAIWNFLTKKSQNKIAFLWVANLITFIILMPFFINEVIRIEITGKGYLFLSIALLFHMLYGYYLTKVYTVGDLSHVYPIMRGTGALLIPIIGVVFLGELMPLLGWIGLFIVLSGILSLNQWKRLTNDNHNSLAIVFALITGCIITGYSVFDKMSLDYLSPIAVLQIGHIGYMISLSLGAFQSNQIKKEWKTNWKYILLCSILMPGSYLLFLLALTIAPISHIAPMREMGIVFGTLLGVFLLKETQRNRRIIASVIITLGVIIIKSI